MNLYIVLLGAQFIDSLEDDPRSTPGHSKVLNPIRAIMKFTVFASIVCIPGLTLELLKCAETLKTTS